MSQKPSKEIIERVILEAINGKVVSEGPFDSVRNVAAGVKNVGKVAYGAAKNVGQVTYGNYNAGKIKSQVQDFAEKTSKEMAKVSDKVAKTGEKMAKSDNPAVSSTGQQVLNAIKTMKDEIGGAVQRLPNQFPSAVGQQSQAQAQPQQAQPQQSKSSQVNPSKFEEFLIANYGVRNINSLPAGMHNRVTKQFDDQEKERRIELKKKLEAEKKQKEIESMVGKMEPVVDLTNPKARTAPKESLELKSDKITHKIVFPDSVKSLVSDSLTKVFKNEINAPAIPPPPPEDPKDAEEYTRAPGGKQLDRKVSLSSPSIPKSEKQTVAPKARMAKESKEIKSMKDLMESDILKDKIVNSIQERKKLSGKK